MTDLPELPPASPEGETVVADERLFIDACKSAIADQAQTLGWSFGNSVLTHSDRWGLVWRVDFFVIGRPVQHTSLINRAIHWGKSDGTIDGAAFLFGQQVAPL
jgi:hypothetical protein